MENPTMTARITMAMILAAGFGKRLRPLTLDCPKPLVPLLGRPMIDWTVERLRAHGVARMVVNAHYRAERIEEYCACHPDMTCVREEEILETGGGVRNALSRLGTSPFFVCNSDTVWRDGPAPALRRLEQAWDADRMDVLLLLCPLEQACGYGGAGDYDRAADGRAVRRREATAPYAFMGVQILHPRLFAQAPEESFSLNILYDQAERAGRLFSLIHEGGGFIREHQKI